MNCEQLKVRITSLNYQIELLNDQLDELNTKPKTLKRDQEISLITAKKEEMIIEVASLSLQFKKQCKGK